MKVTRMINLPAIHASVTIGQYVQAIKMAKANPKMMFKTGLTTWWSTSGKEVMQQFNRGMHDRISQGIPYSQRGMEAI
jgi:hypothetical protein